MEKKKSGHKGDKLKSDNDSRSEILGDEGEGSEKCQSAMTVREQDEFIWKNNETRVRRVLSGWCISRMEADYLEFCATMR